MNKNIYYLSNRKLYFFECFYCTTGWLKHRHPVKLLLWADNSLVNIYYDETDRSPQRAIWGRALENLKWLPAVLDKFKKTEAGLVKYFSGLDTGDLSDKELFENYKRIVNFYEYYQAENNLVARMIDRWGTDIVMNGLKTAGIRDFQQAFINLTASQKESYISQEERVFWEGLKQAGSGKRLKAFLDRHLRNYAWVGRSYFNEPALTRKDLLKRVSMTAKHLWREKAGESRKHLKAVKDLYRKTAQNRRISKDLLQMARLLRQSAELKDYIRGGLVKVFYHSEKIFKGIEKRSGLSPDLAKSLSVPEVEQYLLKGRKELTAVAQRRFTGKYVVIPHGRKSARVLEGDQAEKYYKKYLESKIDETQELKGTPASFGRAKGKVRVVERIEQAAKLKPGEILVVSNTNPAFVPYLKRVAAIVAEEAGVTVHAAIISRELKIPCVIGTKIATKVFKDGDLVEVDAEKGIVRKIK